MVKPTGSKKKDWFLLTSPGTNHISVGSFHLSILSQQAVTHKNTKEAGAGNKEALLSKSPIYRLVGSWVLDASMVCLRLWV